jgi:hypothetical protein
MKLFERRKLRCTAVRHAAAAAGIVSYFVLTAAESWRDPKLPQTISVDQGGALGRTSDLLRGEALWS